MGRKLTNKEIEKQRKEQEERERREQEERERREQREREIRNEIDEIEREVKDLENGKDVYENMRKKINEALIHLTSAEQRVHSSQTELKRAYSSQTSNEQNIKLEESMQGISDIIRRMNNPIIPEIDRKINSINQEILTKQNEIGQLQNELNSL